MKRLRHPGLHLRATSCYRRMIGGDPDLSRARSRATLRQRKDESQEGGYNRQCLNCVRIESTP